MISLRKNSGAVAVVLTCLAGSALPLGAQGVPTTCATAPTAVTSLSIESVLTFSNVLSTLTPNVPANVLAGITSGSQEVRSRLIYNPAGNTITNTVFQVANGAPNPTPIGVDVSPSTLLGFGINVDRVYTSCTPLPSILFVGTVGGSGGTFGGFNGAPAAISIGFTTDTPPKINNVVEVIAGVAVAFSPSANGTLTFPAPLIPPVVTPSGNPTIVVGGNISTTGPNQVFFNPVSLDVSGSTDPGKLPLTYMFTSDKAIDFKPSNTSATPTIYFDAGPGDYTITVKATNSAGLTTSQNIVFQYTGK